VPDPTSPTDRLNAALTGRYRIERELGAGGMATVYLAEDLKHDRKVAIKVLKPELAAVLGAERFVVEIKTTAAMSHPHILPLFDSGTADGFLFYVMPYIEGETIREKLTRETQFGVDEAVRIAREVADALDYAHRHGVIHRDIKPENILLHDGRAMVMDFGIALAVSAAAGGRMTETGLSLGTPHYMSPEQATAEKEITARSDVYSIASVLYEMLAGEPPHTAGSAQAVIMKIITDTVAPVTTLRKTVPQNVAAALSKALQKVPADRFESAKAFGDALGNPAFASGPSIANSPAQRVADARALRRAVVTPWTIAVIAAGMALWFALRTPQLENRGAVRFTVAGAKGARVVTANAGTPAAMSPDGRRLVYVGEGTGNRQLWLRELDQAAPHPIPGTDNAVSPQFSPDGKWVAYREAVSLTWKKVSIDGGAAVSLSPGLGGTIAFVNDGDSVVIAGIGAYSQLVKSSSAGGSAHPLFSDSSSHSMRADVHPVTSPDGRVLFFARRRGSGNSEVVVAASLDGKEATETKLASRPLGWSGGRLFYVQPDGAVMAVPFDLRRLAVAGQPTPTGESVQIGDGVPRATLSLKGDLVYSGGSGLVRPMFVGARIAPVAVPSGDRLFQFPRLSPDGTRIAFTVVDGAKTDIWVFTIASGSFERLTTDGATNSRPEWTPDSRRVLYRTARTAPSSVWWQAADGSGTPERLTPEGLPNAQEGVVSPDGKWLLFRIDNPSQGRDILMMPLDGSQKATPYLATPFDELTARFSPDGKWVAYTSNESGRDEIYLRPFPGPGGRVIISDGGGTEPLWSRDGKRVFYRNAEGVVAASMSLGAAPSVTLRDLVVRGAFVSDRLHPSYDVVRNGDQFLMLLAADGDTQQLTVVLNWAQAMNARLGLLKQ